MHRTPTHHPHKTDASSRNFFLIIATQLIILVVLMGISLRFFVSPPKNERIVTLNSVLGSQTSRVLPKTDVITVLTKPKPIETPIESPQTKTALKSHYTIALIGDSMVDTMGERAEYLEHALAKTYPDVTFTLYNYGKGSQTVSESLSAIENEFHHQDRNHPPLPSIRPDIIISGSFAYNPFTPYDRNHHWIELTHMVERLKQISPNVYLLSEIAPLRKTFGVGHNGVNWDSNTNFTHSGHIIEQLQNAEGLSRTLNVPLIDIFSTTYDENTHEGTSSYIDPSDGIHPSVYGHEKTAEKITETLILD